MIKITETDNGKVIVCSDCGKVDIGEGAVDRLICSPDEIEYVTEVKE